MVLQGSYRWSSPNLQTVVLVIRIHTSRSPNLSHAFHIRLVRCTTLTFASDLTKTLLANDDVTSLTKSLMSSREEPKQLKLIDSFDTVPCNAQLLIPQNTHPRKELSAIPHHGQDFAQCDYWKSTAIAHWKRSEKIDFVVEDIEYWSNKSKRKVLEAVNGTFIPLLRVAEKSGTLCIVYQLRWRVMHLLFTNRWFLPLRETRDSLSTNFTSVDDACTFEY